MMLAYEGEDGMTFVQVGGAVERFSPSLVTACQTVLSTGVENEDYQIRKRC